MFFWFDNPIIADIREGRHPEREAVIRLSRAISLGANKMKPRLHGDGGRNDKKEKKDEKINY